MGTTPCEVILSNKEDLANYCKDAFKKKNTASLIRVKYELSNEEFLFLLKTSPSIEELEISHCGNIVNIDSLSALSKLRSLKLQHCTALKDLSVLLSLSNLTILELTYCAALTSSDVFRNSTRLHTLDLTGCSKLEEVDSLETLPNLASLKLKECTKLGDIKGIKNLGKIINLDLSSCENLKKFEALIGLTSLEVLKLSNNNYFTSVRILSLLNRLTYLDLYSCVGIKSLDTIQNLSRLRVLKLANCPHLKDIGCLTTLEKLTELHLQSCTGLEDFSIFEDPHLRSLKTLNLNNCTGLCDIQTLSRLTKLTHLYLACCSELCDIDSLPKSVTHLYLNECTKLNNIAPLLKSTSLREVDLTGCIHLDQKDISTLRSSCPSVTNIPIDTRGSTTSCDSSFVLGLEQRHSVVNSEALQEILASYSQGQVFSTQLRILYKIDDQKLRELVDKNPHIEDLDLEDCSKLTNINPLGDLLKLSTVRLCQGKKLPSIQPLVTLNLTSITLHKCPRLKGLGVLQNLKNIKYIEVKNCSSNLKKEVEALRIALPDTRISYHADPKERAERAKNALPPRNTKRGHNSPLPPKKGVPSPLKKDVLSSSTSTPKDDEEG